MRQHNAHSGQMPSSPLLESNVTLVMTGHHTWHQKHALLISFWHSEGLFRVAEYVFDKVTHDSCLAARRFFRLVFVGATLLHLSAGSSLWPGSCLRGWWFEAHSWKNLPELSCCFWSYPGSRTYRWTEVSLCSMLRREKLHLEDKVFFNVW